MNGELCGFLTVIGGVPRCPLFTLGPAIMELPAWRSSPVGRYFAERHPGYSCLDWPQNIPGVLESGVGLCCWGKD